MSAHLNTAVHWAPRPVEDEPLTACGRNIDGQCDRHYRTGEACRYGAAWTRSTDLAAMQGRPYEHWPPPCPVCEPKAKAHAR